jgi:hypothetical protein
MLDNGDNVRVDRHFVKKHDPESGGYLVRYADGYMSFSPAAAFEGGYTQVEQELPESSSDRGPWRRWPHTLDAMRSKLCQGGDLARPRHPRARHRRSMGAPRDEAEVPRHRGPKGDAHEMMLARAPESRTSRDIVTIRCAEFRDARWRCSRRGRMGGRTP